MTGQSGLIDRASEHLARMLASRLSRRSVLARLGGYLVAAPVLPLLPVGRSAASTRAEAMTEFARKAQTKDPTLCTYWRYCGTDGNLCACCGGGPHTCPPGTEPSPTSWIGTCLNPDDGKAYLISYRDCCGKDACGRCNCFGTDGDLPSLAELGFAECDVDAFKPGMNGAEILFDDFCARIARYRETRDFPAVKGPSYLSVHLRFGTVSIRELARSAWKIGGAGAETWLAELIWREFYQQILWHRPDVVEHAFKPEYDALPFPNNRELFAAWCEGRTGYPIVDAGIRQLNQTGYMHNRLRMITASFLVKDLLVDWRWGERYFAEKLIDYDLAANNGGWQWAASTGCDAQPYFRIFNPVTQSQRFDKEGAFIRRYCPELTHLDNKAIHAPWQSDHHLSEHRNIGTRYPKPVVDHAVARLAALTLFKSK